MPHKPFLRTDRQRKYEFPNGFGASVISDGYGSEQGLYELGVLHHGHLTYKTPITDDVLGSLTEAEVEQRLDEIAALTPESVIEFQIEKERAERDQRIAELRAELASLEAEVQS